MKKAKNYQQLRQISTATLLEESTHLKLVMKAIIAIIALIAALLIWSSLATIEETAVTFGEIMPKGKVQSLQHLEGGIVSRVLVSNGQRVKKGQLLIKLVDAPIVAELDQLRGREIILTLDSQRWRAYLDNKPANLVEWSNAVINSKYNSIKNHGEIRKRLKDEEAHLASQYKARQDQKSTLQSTILQRKEQLTETEKQSVIWDKHLELLNKEFQMYEKLRKDNLISHKDYLVVMRELNKAQGEKVRLKSKITQTKESIKESANKLNELFSSSHEEALKQLGKVNDSLLEARHKIEKLDGRLSRTNIVAPINGVVKGLRAFAGNVIQPGAILVQVVPYGQQFIVETRINPKDIGHIKVDDKVKVKILTYDFARYGSIEGVLTKISASTYTTEDGKPYYKGTIELKKQFISKGRSNDKNPLKSGMTVEADIVTGEKTILQYLLKPIHQSTSTAFRER
ncbi:MAG: HlyD family type I secretion periplasmic adaptor subunit [Gammaproteobacteria bacterium]|nr:HlyD family type I secretion periplasmic adaptor subunit [Gammaproteobacteria bacterium]